MARRINEIGAVQGVEMEFAHALVDEIEHLLGGDGRGDQLPRRRILVEPVDTSRDPGRYRSAAALSEVPRVLESLQPQDAENDRHGNPPRARLVEKTKIDGI